MAQKDKVKELVGRGLGSYHTKALQQIDRIEKKNKEQNHKISILTNELDNDYLTKTEEGSVISLEHSKEGMIYLDELQGNTLVNYCSDGAKELTLNGEIDVEGTSVTLTEGVDNGLVDVMCEGNTLVNLMPIGATIGGISETPTTNTFWYDGERLNNSLFKPNTKYSVIFYNKHPKVIQAYFHLASPTTVDIVNDVAVFTTPSDIKTSLSVIHFYTSEHITLDEVIQCNTKVIILEGDYTNKPIPSYFEGMKSVGECEDNKIEILSSVGKENLLLNTDTYIDSENSSKTFAFSKDASILKGNTITLSCDIEVENIQPIENGRCRVGIEMGVKFEDDTQGYYSIWQSSDFNGRKVKTISIPDKTIKNIMYIGIYVQCKGTKHRVGRPKIEIGNIATSWCPSTLDNLNGLQSFINKKEISLNEPLRGLPNGECDKFVKQSGKWYMERKHGEVLLNGSENWVYEDLSVSDNATAFSLSNVLGLQPSNKRNLILSDKFVNSSSNIATDDYECIGTSTGRDMVIVKLLKNKFTDSTSAMEFKNWLQDNPFKVVYQLKTPIYEEIVDPTLNTYNDITHISNNSTIPCNMQIKNTGYNAIIKPSTQYTVALDTNKSGTIGLNLGGAKVTTTNNATTITTPATLTDDSLRLYGKGIKASKVRLLEGNKTNWIPSHFEGVKSSFEDKLQEDETYKMEILSNNKNLFNFTFLTLVKNNLAFPLKYLEVGKVYTVKTNDIVWFKICNNLDGGNFPYQSTNKDTFTFTMTMAMKEQYLFINNKNVTVIKDIDVLKTLNPNIQIGSSISSLIENKQNKIQFSSIEPLRGNKFTKDKFIFKDGKLMIERNFNKLLLDGNIQYPQWHQTDMYISIYPNSNDKSTCYRVCNIPNKALKWQSSISNMFTTCVTNEAFGINAREGYLSDHPDLPNIYFCMGNSKTLTMDDFYRLISENPIEIVYQLKEPTYEEIPFELQKIILEGYENGTLFFDTNIPPTVTTTYAGETPIVKATRLNKTEVLNNSNDINDNIVPYLMDMDYRVVCLQLEGGIENISMARLFGGTYEMLQRDILSNRYSKEEYKYRLDAYLSANKITHEEYTKLGDMLND